MKAPCHHCNERKFMCHAECEKYAEFAAWREKCRELNRMQQEAAARYSPGVERAIKKRNHWNQKGKGGR